MHVAMADEAYHVGPPPAALSYLNVPLILDAAKSSGADGIHPGYGFLSENEGFAQSCADEGVTFIGPPVAAINAMGSKSTSKAIMIDAGVPVTPGYHGEDQSVERLLEEAKRIKFPVLIKATLGGGGKGMRLVEKEEDFVSMLDACKREAMKSFSDDTVLLERFVVKPRHVEFQVFGDTLGNVVHLAERDCSVQRRHQKVLEESPAPGLDWDTRNAMGSAAVEAARAVGYVGAGTVEFLVDSSTGEFFFCEMNTRLQVEHPVTEMVTGVDLVEWQLSVAAGNPLPILEQKEIDDRLRHSQAGHAIEARVYAENPLRGFLPATGTLRKLKEPQSPPQKAFLAGTDPRPGAGAGDVTVRVDTGVQEGGEVSIFYDPMISKLIVHASDRNKALNALEDALDRYQVSGVPTNLSFLKKCVEHPAFQKGGVTTAFLDDHGDNILAAAASPAPPLVVATAALAKVLSADPAVTQDPFKASGKEWRGYGNSVRVEKLVDVAAEDYASTNGNSHDGLHNVEVHRTRDGSCEVHVSGGAEGSFKLRGVLDGNKLKVSVEEGDGIPRSFEVDCFVHAPAGEQGTVQLWSNGGSSLLGGRQTMVFSVPAAVYGDGSGGAAGGSAIKAPMPGKVLQILVNEGDEVALDQPLLILEAMKMEHVLTAARAGVVNKVYCSEGAIVDDGKLLADLAPLEELKK
jgi:3-methylcrotonyl-CoA carboxylase alpha subunit